MNSRIENEMDVDRADAFAPCRFICLNFFKKFDFLLADVRTDKNERKQNAHAQMSVVDNMSLSRHHVIYISMEIPSTAIIFQYFDNR